MLVTKMKHEQTSSIHKHNQAIQQQKDRYNEVEKSEREKKKKRTEETKKPN